MPIKAFKPIKTQLSQQQSNAKSKIMLKIPKPTAQ